MLATCNVFYKAQNGNILLYGEVTEDAIKSWTGYGNRRQSISPGQAMEIELWMMMGPDFLKEVCPGLCSKLFGVLPKLALAQHKF